MIEITIGFESLDVHYLHFYGHLVSINITIEF